VQQPDLAERFGPQGRSRCVADALRHLSYLSQAMRTDSAELFEDYVSWARVVLGGLSIPAADLTTHLGILRDVLAEELPPSERGAATRILAAGLVRLPAAPEQVTSFLRGDGPLGELPLRYTEALLAGDRRAASQMVLATVDSGASVRDVYLWVFQPSQHEIGRLWQINRATVAQEHFCTAATQLVMSQLYERIFSTERSGHVLVATCIAGDLHEVGVRMVSDFFEMDGWDTFYLGADTPTSSVLRTVADRAADVLAISATLTPHVRQVADLIAAVRASEECRDVVVLAGGYPFNVSPGLWRKIGADGGARDAAEAVETAKRLIAGQRPA
jgi:methanogenic corrinoid protein MtbC1